MSNEANINVNKLQKLYNIEDRELANKLHQKHNQLASDLQYFSKRTLKVIDKKGRIKEFEFNDAQLAIHSACEHMLKETGWVRIRIVKGRQQGCSTYVAARYFHKAISVPATRVFILSHEASSTKVLFGKVLKFNENCPIQIKPNTDIENRTELEFINDSQYTVGTAGSKNTGRSDTCLLHHYSEPAFYENHEQIKAGLGQTLPDIPGTEAIWESTCNGYNFWRTDVYNAMRKQGIYTIQTYREDGIRKCRLIYKRNGNEGMYRLIFIPWHISAEYRLPVYEGFELTEEERKLKKLYDLDDEQLVWRRSKIEFFNSEKTFKQEYPFTLAEAFQHSGTSFFNPLDIQRAMKSKVVAQHGATILGVDGSSGSENSDRAVIVKRKGRQLVWKRVYYNCTQLQLAAKIAAILNDQTEEIDKVFIDQMYGDAVCESLRSRGFESDLVELVNFGSSPIDDQYANLRAEMFHKLRAWLSNELEQVSMPDDPDIEVDLMMLPDVEESATGRKKFKSKKDIKADNGGLSPDILDALALTFAYPVRSRYDRDNGIPSRERYQQTIQSNTELKTRQRRNQSITRRGTRYGSSYTYSAWCRNSGIRRYAGFAPESTAKFYNAAKRYATATSYDASRYATANGKPAIPTTKDVRPTAYAS